MGEGLLIRIRLYSGFFCQEQGLRSGTGSTWTSIILGFRIRIYAKAQDGGVEAHKGAMEGL